MQEGEIMNEPLLRSLHKVHQKVLGLAKEDLWGLEAESLCFVATCPFAKMILQCINERIILDKGKFAKIHYDSSPRPQRSCFAHSSVSTSTMAVPR